NHDAIQVATGQRLATHEAIAKFDPGAAGPTAKQVRDVLEPTLTPASHASVRMTHLTSDILVITALCAMELRRRRLSGATPPGSGSAGKDSRSAVEFALAFRRAPPEK